MHRALSLGAALLALGLGGCRPPPPPNLGDFFSADPAPLWVPRRVGAFHLAVFQPDEDPARGALYRFVGPDSVLMDVTLTPGPDLLVDCPLDCARDSLRVMVRGLLEAIEGQSAIRVLVNEELRPTPTVAWRLAHRAALRSTQDTLMVRTEQHLYYLPSTRMLVRGSFIESPARDLWVAEFLRYVVDAFSTPPIPLPDPPTYESILRAIEGEWDFVGSPLLCGPRRHTIKASPADSSFTITTPAFGNAAEEVVEYRIQRVGGGIVPGRAHVVRGRMPGETRRGAFGELVSWDLVLEDADRYSWHRNDWYDDQRSVNVLRCDRGPY
jgi:hypothetical protein